MPGSVDAVIQSWQPLEKGEETMFYSNKKWKLNKRRPAIIPSDSSPELALTSLSSRARSLYMITASRPAKNTIKEAGTHFEVHLMLITAAA